LNDGHLFLENVTILENDASPGPGGAVSNGGFTLGTPAILNLSAVMIAGNRAGNGGAIFNGGDGDASILSSS
jgi:hypothetical protein